MAIKRSATRSPVAAPLPLSTTTPQTALPPSLLPPLPPPSYNPNLTLLPPLTPTPPAVLSELARLVGRRITLLERPRFGNGADNRVIATLTSPPYVVGWLWPSGKVTALLDDVLAPPHPWCVPSHACKLRFVNQRTSVAHSLDKVVAVAEGWDYRQAELVSRRRNYENSFKKDESWHVSRRAMTKDLHARNRATKQLKAQELGEVIEELKGELGRWPKKAEVNARMRLRRTARARVEE